ncbi:hypothetical protein HZ326_16098 [Fusarium oxysporum f. sp. albedinis]|nr:hypothetical protein HZ326_16098 [Fusarium oxysporum f. sp. albedinis]
MPTRYPVPAADAYCAGSHLCQPKFWPIHLMPALMLNGLTATYIAGSRVTSESSVSLVLSQLSLLISTIFLLSHCKDPPISVPYCFATPCCKASNFDRAHRLQSIDAHIGEQLAPQCLYRRHKIIQVRPVIFVLRFGPGQKKRPKRQLTDLGLGPPRPGICTFALSPRRGASSVSCTMFCIMKRYTRFNLSRNSASAPLWRPGRKASSATAWAVEEDRPWPKMSRFSTSAQGRRYLTSFCRVCIEGIRNLILLSRSSSATLSDVLVRLLNTTPLVITRVTCSKTCSDNPGTLSCNSLTEAVSMCRNADFDPMISVQVLRMNLKYRIISWGKKSQLDCYIEKSLKVPHRIWLQLFCATRQLIDLHA